MFGRIKEYKNHLKNFIYPAVVFGIITGVFTALVVTLFKLCAKHITALNSKGIDFLREHLYILPVVLAGLFVAALMFSQVYKRYHGLKGGGIPTSIGILRGEINFRWFQNLVGTFILSLVSFLIGVPLGTEGPAVQMGTVIGRGCLAGHLKKHKAWDRYSMTGGACAGFSVATGAPISGVLFAIEEAHQKISPMIFTVASVSVITAQTLSKVLSPVLGISEKLFTPRTLAILDYEQLWIPVVVGVVFGLFSVLFLRCYNFLSRILKKIPNKKYRQYKIFAVFALSVLLGIVSESFVSTGHHFAEELFVKSPGVLMLVLILIVRTILTLSANISGITGGLFLPIMAIGAALASITGNVLISLGLGTDYYSLIISLGVGACIASMMKMPLTAIMFSLEVLSCTENVLPVIIVVAVSYIFTEVFNAKSINEIVIEKRAEENNAGKKRTVIDTHVTVEHNSFAEGKLVRDILWPSNLFVLSVKSTKEEYSHIDVHGDSVLSAGDIIHIRYSTFDRKHSENEISDIVGKQGT